MVDHSVTMLMTHRGKAEFLFGGSIRLVLDHVDKEMILLCLGSRGRKPRRPIQRRAILFPNISNY